MHQVARALLGGLLAATGVQAITITTCNTTVPAHDVGQLAADLVCNDGEFAVQLSSGSTLQLNGHTISTTGGVAGGALVACPHGTCLVEGPGQLVGSADGAFTTGISVSGGRMTVENVALDHVREGVLAAKRTKVIVRNVTSQHCVNECVAGDFVHIEHLSCSDTSYDGIAAGKLIGQDITVTGSTYYGVYVDGSVRVDQLTATGNGRPGLHAHRAMLTNSTLTGNDSAGAGIDLETDLRPILLGTTCGKSQQLGQPVPTPWGVCTNDSMPTTTTTTTTNTTTTT